MRLLVLHSTLLICCGVTSACELFDLLLDYVDDDDYDDDDYYYDDDDDDYDYDDDDECVSRGEVVSTYSHRIVALVI